MERIACRRNLTDTQNLHVFPPQWKSRGGRSSPRVEAWWGLKIATILVQHCFGDSAIVGENDNDVQIRLNNQ